jgi:hypothetical protein
MLSFPAIATLIPVYLPAVGRSNWARPVKVEPWPQAKQQRTPQAEADLDAVAQSGLPASGLTNQSAANRSMRFNG